MKGKSRRTQMRHEVSDFGKVDRVVQKSMNKEVTHYLNIINGGKLVSVPWGDLIPNNAGTEGSSTWLVDATSEIEGFQMYCAYQSGANTTIDVYGLVTLNRWDEIARVEKVKEPLKLYGLSRGTRSYWMYMPLLWAEKQGMAIDKAGGE